MATGRAAASRTQKSEATTKKSSNNRKTVDWTREETEELLQAWGPKFEELKKVSTKERGRIWSEIYNKYKERFTESVRTLPQLKKRIQNLEYEFKNLKVRVKKTGEEGFKKIKQGFPLLRLFGYNHRSTRQRGSFKDAKSKVLRRLAVVVVVTLLKPVEADLLKVRKCKVMMKILQVAAPQNKKRKPPLKSEKCARKAASLLGKWKEGGKTATAIGRKGSKTCGKEVSSKKEKAGKAHSRSSENR